MKPIIMVALELVINQPEEKKEERIPKQASMKIISVAITVRVEN